MSHTSPSLLVLLLAALASADSSSDQIYKTVDKDGKVIFSDQPAPQAEPVNVGRTNSMQPPAATGTPADTAPTEPTAVVYESVEITSPADGGTVTNPSGNILVLFTLAPALREGDSTRLLIDGMPPGMPAEGGLLAPTTSRGEHRLEVQVLDAAGTVLATSAPVYVTVFRNPVRDKPGRPPRSN
jgi:hypothetical protein